MACHTENKVYGPRTLLKRLGCLTRGEIIHHALVSSSAVLPTNDPAVALAEIERASNQLHADGFAVTCNYHGVYLGDPSLNDVWAELNRLPAVVFIHPDA